MGEGPELERAEPAEAETEDANPDLNLAVPSSLASSNSTHAT